MKKIKVLLLIHSLGLTGAPKVILDIFESLKDDIDLRILSPESGLLQQRCSSLGVLYILSELPQGSSLFKRLLRKLKRRRWEKDLQKWNPDLIYVNSVASLRFPSQIRLPIAPAILHVHELQAMIEEHKVICPDYWSLFKSWPSKYIAVSQSVATILDEKYNIEKKKTSLVYECVRDEDFYASRGSGESYSDKKFSVGGSGYPSWRKGIILWLQMAVDLTNIIGRDKVEFTWVGMPDFAIEEYVNIADKLGISDIVSFVAVTKDPINYYLQFDVFAMTSWEDPCPIVVLENMMLEKPVFCFSNSGGAPEEIADAGFVIQNFSPKEMAVAISEVANSPALSQELGKAARKRVEQNFLVSLQGSKIKKEIQDLISLSQQ